jgi:cytochrome c oxidase subunit III
VTSHASPPPIIDVSRLPLVAFGSRSLPWWGAVLLILIEATGFLLLLAAYLYLRGNSEVWPPEGIRSQDMIYAAIGTVALTVSAVPNHLANAAALRGAIGRVRLWLLVATLLAIVAALLRAVEFRTLPFTWYSHAYGSVFWTILGMHSVHLATGILENLFVVFVLLKGPVEQKHQVDVRAGGLYWYFLILSWLPLFGVLYGERF